MTPNFKTLGTCSA